MRIAKGTPGGIPFGDYRSSFARASSWAGVCSVMAEQMVTVLPRVRFLQPSSSFFISLAAMGAQEPFSMKATWRFW